jgi:Ca2+-binding EF-hand superfamily protein
MQARTRNLLAVALATAVFSPLALAQSVQGAVNGAAHGQVQLPSTPAMPQAPTLPTQASTRADTAVSAAMQHAMPSPADGEQMQTAQQPQTAVDAQVKGAAHAQAHSAVATRDVFGKLDADGDGKISATEAAADTGFGFATMDSDGDGFVTDAEYRASAKGAMDTSQGAAHAAGHSEAVARDVFGTLDTDGDGKISATEASADAGFNGGFTAMDGDGDGFVSDAEFRAHAKADMPTQP